MKSLLRRFMLLALATMGLAIWNESALALFGTDTPYAERVTDGRFPAVVRIWFPGYMGMFSGVLISPKHVLTAAHCAPLHGGEIHDSAWHETHGGHANDVEYARFSFAAEAASGEHPYYTAAQYWVHPDYNPDHGTLSNWDLMVLVIDDPITEVDPVPVLAPSWSRHVQPGAWVRHVSFGPTEGAGAHAYKTTLLTRVTEVSYASAQLYTMGEAGGGDSGSPLFQMREDDSGAMREVLVGILTNEGIRCQLMTNEIDSWIREIVYKMFDITLMPDDYDGDGIINQSDYCMLKPTGLVQADSDADGIGDACDTCPDTPNGGQMDTDGDGFSNGCDDCPFPADMLSFDELVITTTRDYWTRSPTEIAVAGVHSDGRWMDDEYTTHIGIVSPQTESSFIHVVQDNIAMQDNSGLHVVVTTDTRSTETDSPFRVVGPDDLAVRDNSDLRLTPTTRFPAFGAWTDEDRYDGLRPLLWLPEGEYDVQVHIEDGCGNISETQIIGFGVDDTPPALTVRRFGGGPMVPVDGSFTVEVTIEDGMSGVGRVSLWLDNPPSDDEFSWSRKLCDLSGPWSTGALNTKRCPLTADFTGGAHTIYAVAEDLAGNESVSHCSIFCYHLVSGGSFMGPNKGGK